LRLELNYSILLNSSAAKMKTTAHIDIRNKISDGIVIGFEFPT